MENIKIENRPENISKLALFLSDKEPLLYLFIINSDFVPDREGEHIGDFIAGVSFLNRRVVFFYSPEKLAKMPAEELFFLVIHEADHIFKKHIDRGKKLKNHTLANIAEDMIINEEINSTTFSCSGVLAPKMPPFGCVIPEKFKSEFHKLGKDAFVSERLYNWLANQKVSKKQLLSVGSYVRIKGSDSYGRIDEITKDGEYKVSEMSKNEMLEEMNGGEKKNGKKGTYTEDELIPVVAGSSSGFGLEGDFEVESFGNIDAHPNKEMSESDKVDSEVFSKKLVKQAREAESKMKLQKNAGTGSSSYLSKIEGLLKSRVSWKKELNKRLNLFVSDNKGEMGRKNSIINYPWNPKSRYGILCKHTIETLIKKQAHVIFAIDTSGSCFFDKYEIESFFTEIEAVNKEFAFSKKGRLLTIQWDYEVVEGLKEYKKNDWKKYALRGGGGTNPESVFKYIDKIYQKKNGWYVVNERGIRFLIEDKKKLPLLVFLTDGCFFNKLDEKKIGVYANSKKNLLFFTRNKDMIYPRENYIIYK